MIIKKFGFTLGEILMALAIIGIISTLTIPHLNAGKMASQSKAEFDTAYANLSRAVSEMEADEIDVTSEHFAAARSFYPVLKDYFNIALDCGVGVKSDVAGPCPKYKSGGNNLKNINGTVISDYEIYNDGAFVTNNGMLIMIENPSKSTPNPDGLLVTVDINGKIKPPNKLGYDIFTFEVTKGQVVPVGSALSKNAEWKADPEKYCNKDDKSVSSWQAGITCSLFAVSNDDYFQKIYNGK